MSLKIDHDHGRFREIVRGKIKQNLRKYISQGELIGARRARTSSRSRCRRSTSRASASATSSRAGSGRARARSATRLGRRRRAAAGQGQGRRQARRARCSRSSVTLDELAEILGEELELPRIEPKGKSRSSRRRTATSASAAPAPSRCATSSAPTARRCAGRSRCGTYDPKNPVIVPIRDDKRYRSWRTTPLPQSNAVIIYMMDVSGSMGDEQKEIVRIESFWIDTWLRRSTRASSALHHPRRRGARRSIATPSSTRASRAAR